MPDKSTYCDIKPFLRAHEHTQAGKSPGGSWNHIHYLGGPQVVVVCEECGICQTIDQISAGNLVVPQ